MLREACRRAGNLPVEFQEMDAEALQFADATFDAALGGLLPEVVPAMSEMHRVLRPGGRAGFSIYTPETLQPLADVTWSRLERHRIRRPPDPPEPWTALSESEQLLLLLEKAGFQEAQVVPEPHIHTLQSAEDWWTYMRRSTRWGVLLDQFSAMALEDLKAEILEDVERLRTKEGIQVDTSALIGIGVRR
jgi:ubiquinone/menaquinone biosynthesis C-methylase UbiE